MLATLIACKAVKNQLEREDVGQLRGLPLSPYLTSG
jgi:hypothetical protein